MFWPKEKIKYEYLKTTFTDLVNLVGDLQHSGFKGFLEVTCGDKKNYILILEGPERLFQQTSPGKLTSFEGGVEDLVNEISPDTAIINVYEADPQHLLFILSCINAAPLYTNLSSEFTDFEKLLNKLTKDGLNGYLEVVFRDVSLQNAYFIYKDGRISDIFIGEEQIDSDENKFGGVASLLNKNEALFNVYSADENREFEISPPEETNEKTWAQEPFGETEKTAPSLLADDRENDLAVLDLAESGESDGGQQPEGEAIKADTVKTPQEEKPADMVSADNSSETLNHKEQLSIKPYLNFSGVLLKWVEIAMDQTLGNGYFSKTFKKGLLNISDKYPFLDPFMAEFTYTDGNIQFSSEATTTEFLSGIYAAIESVFDELSPKERKEIVKKLRDTLQTVEKGFHEDIEILRVRTLMPLLFQ